MAERNFVELVRSLMGKDVTILTRGGEKIRGTLADVGRDYVLIQREQMTPLILPIYAIDAIG